MCNLSNTTGSDSICQTSGKNGNIADSFTGKVYHEDLIDKANTVSLIKIFKHYGVRLDENNLRTTCPFSSHKGGRERTPSFNFYPKTNTYHCFGCNKGHTSCDFIANKERISVVSAAYKILELFGSDVSDGIEIPISEDFVERTVIQLDFSNSVREFRQCNFDQKSFEFIERICKVYDDLNLKRDLTNEALRKVVDSLKERISLYI